MIYYLIPIIIGLLFSFFELNIGDFKIKSPSTRKLFVLFSAIIFCGGYMAGSDWVNYELIYNHATYLNLKYYNSKTGFYLLMLIFKMLGFGFFPFMVICKFFVFYVLSNFLSNIFKSFYLPFTIFLSTYALFLFVDNPLRFMIAFGFVVLSYKYLLNSKIIPYLLLVIIAATIHISSLIMIFLYFSSYIKIYNKYRVILIYLFFSILLSPAFISQFIARYFPEFIALMGLYYERMITFETSAISIGRIVYFFFFILVINNRDKIINYEKYGMQIYAFTIAYFYLQLLGWSMPTFFRLSLFLLPFLCISLSIILLSEIRLQRLLRLFFVSYLIFSTISEIYSTYVYVPYTNYFTSLFKDDLPYSYRAHYNKNIYFERTGKRPE